MAHVGQKRSFVGDRDDALLAQLRAGVEGSTVLEGLVQKNGQAYTLASFSTIVSNLRSKFIKTGHKSIDCYNSSLALRKFAHLEAEEDATEAKAVPSSSVPRWRSSLNSNGAKLLAGPPGPGML